MQLYVKARLAVAHILFIDDLLEAEISHARGAVFFIGPHEQIALLARLGERRTIDETLLAPFFSVRRDFILKKSSHRCAKLVVFWFTDEAAHGFRSACGLARSSRIECLAAGGTLPQPLRGRKARAVTLPHALALCHERFESHGIDQRQRPSRPRRKTPGQQRSHVRVGGMRNDALFHATSGLERLNIEKPPLEFIDRGLHRGGWECVLEAAPQVLDRALRILVKALTIAFSRTFEFLDHAPHHLIGAGFDKLAAQRRLGLLDDFPRQFDRNLIPQRQRPTGKPLNFAAFSIKAGATPSSSMRMPSWMKVWNTRLV